jgi:hypothetical protein
LAKDAEPRVQRIALVLAMRLPEAAFAGIRDDLVPLLDAKDDSVSLEAMTCFAKRKDRVAGPPVLRRLKLDRIDAGQAVTVMQALNALADSAFSYDMHNWGPKANGQAIARFETWLHGAPGR